MHRLRILSAVLIAVLVVPSSLRSQTWASPLGPEVAGATGSGFATVTYDPATFGLAISANWAGLSGTTTIAHIHCCTLAPNTGTVGVAVTPGTLPGFPVGSTSGTYFQTVNLNDPASFTAAFLTASGGTVAGARSALFAGMNSQTAYFNIHTTTFPGGEIRGFLTTVPEPSTYALMATGLAGVGLAGWRRRRA